MISESAFACTDSHLVEHAFQLRGLLLGQLHIAELALPEQRDFPRLAFVAKHHDFFARQRNIRQALDFDRNGRTGLLDRVTGFIQHRTNAAEHRAGKDDVAALERSRLDENSRDRTAALVEPRFDHDAAARARLSGPSVP